MVVVSLNNFHQFQWESVHRTPHIIMLEVNCPLYYILPPSVIGTVSVAQLKQVILWKLDDI